MDIKHIRTRWAAVGAAVAITLGAGGISITQATTSSGEMPIFKSINPCRLADLRPAPNTVGPRTAGLGPDETYTLDGWGVTGNCTLPTGTSGLALNVTAVSPTAATFLRLWPAGGAQPTTSNLNPTPGQPPTPNAVNVGLSGTGQFSIFNRFGSVNVIIDVVGYYDDHEHTGDDIVDNSVSNRDTSNEPGIAFTNKDSVVSATTTPTSMVGTSIRVPSDGFVEMQVTGIWFNASDANDQAFCQLQKGEVGAIDVTQPWIELNDRNAGQSTWLAFSAHRIVPISAADNPFLFIAGQAINLVCDEQQGDVRVAELQISATFFATSYQPAGFVVL